MDWKTSVNKFFEKGKSTLSFYEFFHNTLNFNQKDISSQWKSLSKPLKEWNEKHLLQCEKIVLYSPVLYYTLDIYINQFCISENETRIEDWLYWACLSAHTNICISLDLTLRMEENKKNPIDFFIKTKEDAGLGAKNFVKTLDGTGIRKSDYVWIDTETFLQELAGKREHSYKRIMEEYLESTEEQKEYLQNWILNEYEKYKKYEAMFQNGRQNKTLEIVEINPQGMGDLCNDSMWYLVKMENQVYLFSLTDYDDSYDDEEYLEENDCV